MLVISRSTKPSNQQSYAMHSVHCVSSYTGIAIALPKNPFVELCRCGLQIQLGCSSRGTGNEFVEKNAGVPVAIEEIYRKSFIELYPCIQ